ncbi:transglutaminase family protein [Telmatospirillum sp.]|uniref:transglutaminase family protein n=1 Tax=Telmatospirillum sp. TaxID=2079197 RepID=UPI002850833B|nr:transglutaminase family protein [Telmatospirillum sp.]MDR3440077.1 transglutaminase family protein [Telmatospirillum sp.]
MSIHVALNHKTIYHYDRPVKVSPQIVRLRPASHSRTRILSYSLKVEPSQHFVNWQQDPQGNFLARLVFPEPMTSLSFEVDLVAEMAVHNPFDFFLEPSAEQIPFAYDPVLAEELKPFLAVPPPGPQMSALLASVDRTPRTTIDFLVGLNQDLQRRIGYVIRLEPGVQACEETLAKGTGSCRDSAWLLVQILRNLGLAARFVSGYLIQLVPDQKPLDGPTGPERDFTDLHAWTEVYLPGAGWIGLDPTSGLLAGEGHIPLAATPAPGSAAPITGAVDPCDVTFSHQMTVTRVWETPRVTKPYDDAQWSAIDALGEQIDEKLRSGDVRLTMGGEPTFVSIDDMDAPEWNIAAVGPTKRQRAYDLICRLRDRFASGGLLTFGQGKWYPGESLPRWAFALYWRGDGKPLWNNPDLIAKEGADDQPDEETARLFGERLCQRLGIDPHYLLATYEDPLHYIAREQALPLNVDPLDCKLDDPEERARLARVFSHGLERPVGFALPIQRWNAKGGPHWISGPWPVRRGRLFLVPGDSPVGYRLPLESLPQIPPASYPWSITQDPFDPRGPLPDPQQLRQSRPLLTLPPTDPKDFARGVLNEQRPSLAGSVRETERGFVSDNVRTALTLQPRDGKLTIFMPPTDCADDFVDLVTAIEDTAEDLAIPVHLEGYPPPQDHRLNVIKVTPDPGVIEVNIHPSASWATLRDTTMALYDCAREARLGTEKFMLDGRHTGTGGGNHIVVGGTSAPDSPFLRRPDLLASLVRFWQNHPCLSYLFSGLFIGPTSQAPRVDEARDDILYELQIALGQVPLPGLDVPPWLVDRIFRNLLVDVTGNTHRTEICIDKLFSPDSPTGRLGLVEFRAFEMPPHARMSCAQQLLLRALIARFWFEPYTQPLVRWGHALRDRFMLPHFIWADFTDLLGDMRRAGYPFQDSWFSPHYEFRFPRYGDVTYDGIGLELRQALEPWHVMGEEPGAGGTARYVDSSIERLQVRVTGMTGERHVICCNGRRVPLTSTGSPGEFIAGVRYRAWQPPACLHPTIGVHAPLVFDVVDSWNRRSIGGCTYHVSHPGGRNYETFPVNANEAESRRLARFFAIGHTPGTVDVPADVPNPDFPTTLDLRLSVC